VNAHFCTRDPNGTKLEPASKRDARVGSVWQIAK